MKHIERFLLLAVGLTACFSGLAFPQKIQPSGVQQLQTILQEKASRTPAQRKLDSHLHLSAQLARGALSAATMPGIRNASKYLKFDELQRVHVDIQGKVNDELLGEIEILGGTVESSFPKYGAIRAWIPLLYAESLAERADVTFIRPAAKPIHYAQLSSRPTTAGERLSLAERRENVRRQLKAALPSLGANHASTRLSEVAPLIAPIDMSGLISEGADLVHNQGFTGTGVKVGVVSDGVYSLATLQASGDLPANVTVIPGQTGPTTGCPGATDPCDEGTAMLETIYDLAPGAQLFFATGAGGEAQMATNIQSLAAAGCNIIVDGISYIAEGVFQDGIIAAAVNTVTVNGVLYFSAAGNLGNLDSSTSGTWEGDFNGTGATIPVLNTAYGTTVQVHAFDATHNYDAIIGTSPLVTLKWSDPLGAACNDYDLIIMDSTLSNILDSSSGVQDCSADPIEGVNAPTVGSVIVVVLYSGAPRALHVNSGGGQLAIGTSGATFGHNAAGSTLSVAATHAQATIFTAGNQAPEPYSSDGPRKMFYGQNGAAITPGNFLFGTNGGITLSKVDFTTADCGESAVPGFSPFCGTSAAAPTAAAIAALVLSVNPSLTSSQVIIAMKESALAEQTGFHSRTVGAGIAMANLSVDALSGIHALPTLTSLSPSSLTAGSAAFTLTVNGSNFVTDSVVRWNGFDHNTTFVSSRQLTASILASDILATGGAVQVTVFNTPPGGGSSNAVTFKIPDFSLSANPLSATVTAGQAAEYTLTVTPLSGFAHSVSLGCGYEEYTAPCSVTPDNLTLDGTNNATATVRVTTTARSLGSPPVRVTPPGFGLRLPTFLLLIFLTLALLAIAVRHQRTRFRSVITLAVLALISALVACGGGGKGPADFPLSKGTPAGTSSMTIRVESGSVGSFFLVHYTTLSLTVK
jgi:predicted small lipoprotein YifL